ncbi:MAG: GH92 family glycosyl hydrolase [Eubacteriales bacterium]
MKKTTQILSALLSGLLALAPLSALGPFSFAASGSEDIPDKLLFSSSFESTDPAPLKSVSDNGYYNNVELFEVVSEIDGEFTDSVLIDSIAGSSDYKDAESKKMLFDKSLSTKFLTEKNPSANDPVWVSFSLVSPQVVGIYAITSANDEDGRDPKAWTLYGSADGKNYVELDSRSGQKFTGRGQLVVYEIENNTAAYQYYKLEITQNNGAGMTQLADLRLGTGIPSGAEDTQDSPMTTVVGSGPNSSWNKSGAFDGSRALAVYGKQTQKTDTYARNLLYSGLNIPVTAHTNLSYVHFPALSDGSTYDYEYTSMHLALDVKFTDGSYLSELSAVDQNGFGMDPVSKGESDALFTMQWNYIETCLGDVAEGKTIDSLYVYFRMDESTTAAKFMAYFDDIVIEDKTPVTYEHLSDYIVTTRGTNCTTSFSRGLTTPFCAMPNGFNFYTPVTEVGSNQPYHYQNNTIYQFSVSHVPSTWVGDYGTWQFMANTSVDPENMTDSSISSSNVGATFDHDNEVAKAHYYSVTFDEGSKASGVRVEMTPTVHGVYVRFTFPEGSDNVNVIFDCVRASGSVAVKADGSFTAVSKHTERGSGNLQVCGTFDQTPLSVHKSSNGKTAMVTFPEGTTEVTMKFATSFLSQNQASHNLELEIPDGETFDTVFAKAQQAWDDICGIIEIEGASYTQMTTFYSCMYRLYSYPNLYSENKGTNEEPEWVYASPYHNGKETAGKLYVNNGFWDTYRTAWAAYALLTPTLDGELLNGLLTHYEDNGWIPRWVAPGGTSSMLGTSSDIIFADAYVKGIEFDIETAFESMLRNASTVSTNTANGGREENNTAPFVGYVSNAVGSGFSWSMEDYISDYCIGVMAEMLGKTDEAEYYYNRARFYTILYNENVGFFMGMNSAGNWTYGSDYSPSWWWGDYTETNGWTMTFAPVFDGNGLATLFGGKEALAKKLDSYFDNSITAMKQVQSGSIHEMVEAREVRLGQYGHSNQPAHAIPYLYAYADQPYKTQALVRDILDRLYVGSEIGQGYCGDEDNGEMSGWYILSSLGIYPQNMGSGQYIIGAPLFDKATVHLENGKDLVIIAENNSSENVYIQSATLNGEAFNSCYIDHSTLLEGGTLSFVMGNQPSTFGVDSDPKSLTAEGKSPAPITDLIIPTGRSKTSIQDAAFDPAKAAVYCQDITNYRNLFDNDSTSTAKMAAGGTVVWSSKSGTSLSMITLTCGVKRAGSAPKAFTLEASNDGVNWKTLIEKTDLVYNWDNYIMPFAIPDDAAGVYLYYRLTFPSGGTLGEIELLGESAADAELTPIEPSADPDTPVDPEEPGVNPADPTEPDDNKSIVPMILIIVGAVLIAGGIAVVILFVAKKKKQQ